jgi:hypothetical protein
LDSEPLDFTTPPPKMPDTEPITLDEIRAAEKRKREVDSCIQCETFAKINDL